MVPPPQVDKTFDPPLAARPIPIRTGSVSPTTAAACNHARAIRLRKATSILGMRSLQGISQLRTLTLPQKARDRSESNSGSSLGSRSIASRKGTREQPLIVVDHEHSRALLENPIVRVQETGERSSTPLPVLGPLASAVCAPFLDMKELDKFQGPTLTPTTEVESLQEYIGSDARNASSTQSISRNSAETNGAIRTSAKRLGGVELWKMSLEVDHDALRDALEEHPSPPSSNPTSEHDDEQPTTPWTTVSFETGDNKGTAEFAWQNDQSRATSPSYRHLPRSATLDAVVPASSTSSPLSRRNRTPSKRLGACDTLPQLRRQVATLRAGNSALLTLKAAQEETIAILHENIRNQNATILQQENTVADLRWQVQAKETEQVSIIENFCAEIASQSREIVQLGEDKWYLMGRVQELELKLAGAEETVAHNPRGSAKPREETIDGSMPTTPDEVTAEHLEDEAAVKTSPSLAAFSRSDPSSPRFDPSASIINTETPATVHSSLLSRRLRNSASNQSLYAITPTPSVRQPPSVHISTNGDTQDCLLKLPSRDSKLSLVASASGMKDEASAAEQCSRYARDSQMTAAQVVLAAKARLEQNLAGAQEKLAASQSRSLELQAQVACQSTLIQQLTSTSAGQNSTGCAHQPIADIPVLTYTRSGAVWLDRVTSSFAYLGLLDFVQRDVPRPETSTWHATEVTDWTSRRRRAVVLLKNAVDDDILEDVLHLQDRKETLPGERDFWPYNSAVNDPHQLLRTITSLRRIVSATAADLSWLDRIERSDFNEIEGFTALVLCIDKRHSVLFGTSADHYDALLPKLQETMARLFPELKGSLCTDDFSSGLPKKWRQLPIWMAKVVKRRHTSGDA